MVSSGSHPRIGAPDVCPFVPVANVTMEECVECARDLSQQLAEELEVPVFLYECAQEKEYRKSLGQIREGEYEGLREKVSRPPLWWSTPHTHSTHTPHSSHSSQSRNGLQILDLPSLFPSGGQQWLGPGDF